VVGSRLLAAAAPLALWVLSNLWRYHWVVPQAPGAHGTGDLGTASTTNLNLSEISAQLYVSIVNSVQESFHWWEGTIDWRPLALFVPLTLIGIACALLRGSERQRSAIALWLLAFAAAHLSVFAMLYLALVLTGGGDFVFRYFSATMFAAACLAGTCFGVLFRHPALQRSATLLVGVGLAYWTYMSSPL
jgi:hypothetical protein